MKWTLSNYSHKSNFLFYYREGLLRPSSEFCFKQVFSDFTASLDAFWHVPYSQSTFVWELTVRLGVDFMLHHSYLTTVSWHMVNSGSSDEFWTDNGQKIVETMQK